MFPGTQSPADVLVIDHSDHVEIGCMLGIVHDLFRRGDTVGNSRMDMEICLTHTDEPARSPQRPSTVPGSGAGTVPG